MLACLLHARQPRPCGGRGAAPPPCLGKSWERVGPGPCHCRYLRTQCCTGAIGGVTCAHNASLISDTQSRKTKFVPANGRAQGFSYWGLPRATRTEGRATGRGGPWTPNDQDPGRGPVQSPAFTRRPWREGRATGRGGLDPYQARAEARRRPAFTRRTQREGRATGRELVCGWGKGAALPWVTAQSRPRSPT